MLSMKRLSARTCILNTIILIFFFCSVQNICSENENGTHKVASAVSYNIQKGIEPNVFYFDLLYSYTHRYCQITAGLQTTSANTDGLLQAEFFPLNITRHRIGTGLTYHISALHDIGTEHDLLASGSYHYTVPDRFILFLQSGYMHTWLRIPIPNYPTIVIENASMTAAFHLTGIIKKEWHIGFGMSSYELFRYPLFLNPSFNATLDYHSNGILLPQGLHVGLSCALRYSDLFTLSGYPENVVIRSVVEITVKK